MTRWLREARPTVPSHLQLQASLLNGCQPFWDTSQPQERNQSLLAWRGQSRLRFRRSYGGHWELVAMPTLDPEGVTTLPSWWEWVACWAPVKCRTSVTDSISSLARTAEQTHPPLTPRVPIVMDELVDTPKHPQQVYLYPHLFIS